jgi:hypothetical protein
MVDVFSLLVSLGMMAMMVFFAIRMDKTREWFERPRNPKRAEKEGAGVRALSGTWPARPGAGPVRVPTRSRFPGGR